MKAGFIGIGRMGQAMARRLLDGGHDVSIYNRTAEKLKPLIERGAKALESISAATHYGEAVFTMLADDAAVMDVATKPGGLVESLPRGCIHICAGTHSVACIAALKALHEEAGQVLLATPMLGRPEMVLSGQAGSLSRCDDRRPVRLLGLQSLRQDHRRATLSAGRATRCARTERRQSRTRCRRGGRRPATEWQCLARSFGRCGCAWRRRVRLGGDGERSGKGERVGVSGY